MPGLLGGLGNIARFTPQGMLVNGIRNLMQGQPFFSWGSPNWGQTGSASNPAAGQSAFGSSTTPTTYTPNPTAPAAPSAPSAPAAPGAYGGAYGAPADAGVAGGGQTGGPFSMPFGEGPGSMWGDAAGAAPAGAAGPVSGSPLAVNANPGAGPLAVDWGPAGKPAQLHGAAQ